MRRAIAGLALIAAAAGAAMAVWTHADTASVLRGIAGPAAPSVVARALGASTAAYGGGSASRLAVLLTDPGAYWLGLAYGLKSIGVPFRMTTDYREALRHRVVLVYPIVSGRVLSPDAFRALAAFPGRGGTLIAVNVLGGGLESLFGFSGAAPSKTRFAVRFTAAASRYVTIAASQEAAIRLGDPAKAREAIGTYGYTHPERPPLAVYDDGTAAITERVVGPGRAYAFGLDPGDFMLIGYDNREQWMARSYVNGYEPAIDMLLRLVRALYAAGEPSAVTLGTVPFDRLLPVLLTHDIDYSKSVENAVAYAEFERSQRVRATYFVETKYVRDYNDAAFFDDRGVRLLRRLDALGMEIGSHTVAHSRAFAAFPLGTGREAFPSYRPFVRDRRRTDGGTILGELRVSKFLLEKLVGHDAVVSFRAGELSNPYALPQALAATGYRFSSSVTANDSLTHLPFQLTYGREGRSETPIFEFPITVEDEAPPPLGARLGVALDLAHQLSLYGGSFVILIHPNILGHKLEFEKGFVRAMRDKAWFGSVSDFGRWWAARNAVQVDVTASAAGPVVHLRSPLPIDGLTVRLPREWTVRRTDPHSLRLAARPGTVVLGPFQGEVALLCRPGPAGPP